MHSTFHKTPTGAAVKQLIASYARKAPPMLIMALAILLMAGCGVVIATGRAPHDNDPERVEREQRVRVTLNVEVVKGCEFLGTFKPQGGSTANVATALKSRRHVTSSLRVARERRAEPPAVRRHLNLSDQSTRGDGR